MYGHRLLRELFGLLFLFCGLLMLLSLWSYNAADPTFNQATNVAPIHNAAGQFGAYLAGFLVDLFGIASFLWVLFFLAVGAGLVSRWLVLKWYRWIGYLLLYLCTLVFFSAAGMAFHGMTGGGFAGRQLCEISYRFLSPYGSVLLWVFAFLIAMELSFSVSWLTLLGRFVSRAITLVPSFGETFDLPGAHLGETLKNFSLPSFSIKTVLEKLKLKKEAIPHPTLDILSEKKTEKSPAPNAPGLTLDLEGVSAAGSSHELGESQKELAEPAQNSAVPAPAEVNDEVLSVDPGLTLVDEPERLMPDAHAEEMASSTEPDDEFVLVLEEEVESASVPFQTGPVPEAEVSASAQTPDPLPREDTAQKENEPVEPIAIPASADMETDDFPAMFTAASGLEKSEAPADSSQAVSVPEAVSLPDAAPADEPGVTSVASVAAPSSASVGAANLEESPTLSESPVQTPSAPQELRPDASSPFGTRTILPDPEPARGSASASSAIPSSAENRQGGEARPAPPFPYARIIRPAPGHEAASSAEPAALASTSAAPEAAGKFPQDEEYASVAVAVSQAMAAQHSEEQPAPAPAPALPEHRVLPLPPLELLDPLSDTAIQERPDSDVLERQGEAVITCLKNFNVHATLARITPGPVITMFEVRPAPGVKATRITNLADDLAMSLKATAVRMQAPVPGTDTVGVEVPNPKRATVFFREIVEDETFRGAESLLTVALGKDTGGRPFSADLARMPHLLVAGATGQGKSVCLNAILLSLLCRARPDEVQLILVDPKRVEFSMYADLPHLVHPVVTDMDLTKNALLWAIDEMTRRLSLFSKVQVRNITGYNERQARLREAVEAGGPVPVDPETGEPEDLANMPFLVIVVDELADLMMIKRKEVEGSIVRLAQLARAAGIHLILATQRPSVDVVTGLIKVNFPCRIAFKVTSSQDSRTILDGVGAEKLLGMGDMLFKASTGMVKRIHGAFVSDSEVSALVDYWKKLQKPNYKVDFAEFGSEEEDSSDDVGQSGSRGNDIVDDPMYSEAVQFALENGKVSISLLQRRFRIGFNRAARFVDQMERDGILSEADGTRPRSVVRR